MSERRTTRVEGYGWRVEAPIPPRVAGLIAVVVTVAVCAVWAYRAWREPERAIETFRQQAEMSRMENDHYNRHAFEPPRAESVVFQGAAESFSVRLYRDWCQLLNRVTPDGSVTRLLLGLTPAPPAPAPAGPGGLRERLNGFSWGLLPAMLVAPLGADGSHAPGAITRAAGQGMCLNPHPGPFEAWFGAEGRNCWVEYWRRWPDSCTHYQWHNPCTGAWETNPDGSPRVYWTRCVH